MLYDYSGRLLIAGLVGLVIGMFNSDSRTIRLFTVTCLGATLVTIVSTEFYKMYIGPWFSDPGRLAAQVISALGFIGTGLIWVTEDRRVEGMPAATSLWLTSIMGILIGAGLKNASVAAAFGVVLIYWILNVINKWHKTGKND
ncbi:MgtC/SapB family protein [Syntrophomonas erecta]